MSLVIWAAADGKHHCVPYITVDVNCHVGCAAAQITDDYAHFLFIFGQDNLTGSEGIEHKLGNLARQPVPHICRRFATVAAAAVMMWASTSSRYPCMPIGWRDAILLIYGEAALNDVDDLAAMRDGNGPGSIQCSVDVVLVDDPARYAGHATAVHRGDVRPGQADQSRGDFHARGALSLLDRAGYSLGSGRDVNDRAFADPLRWLDANAKNPEAMPFLQTCLPGCKF